MEIKYLKHNQINKLKWDSAIENSQNGLVYALSWYLDIVSPSWEALIVGNYDVIMPLPVKEKYGLKYLIQPPFCQQLGIYLKGQYKENLAEHFIKSIPSKYKYVSLNLNFNSRKYCTERTNFELNLSANYDYIKNNYSTNTKRNISKAKKQELKIIKNILPLDIWNFKKENPVNNLSKWHYQKLLNIIETTVEKGMGESYAVTNLQNDFLSVAFLINYKNRLTFLVSSSNQLGKEKSAMFILVDQIIRKYAKKKEIFDFEGGSVSGLARFFSGFAAIPVKYYHYKRNRLIWPLNKLV